MINAREIYLKSSKPYDSIYGSRSQQRSAGNINTLVNFSFLLPRQGLDIDDLQELTPEWEKDMLYIIKEFDPKD